MILCYNFIFMVRLVVETNIAQINNLFTCKLGSIFLFSALICTAFGHMTYNYAIKQVGPAESAIFINLNTVFALTGAAFFLGEAILINHIIGLILILFGVLIGSGAVEYLIKNKYRRKHP